MRLRHDFEEQLRERNERWSAIYEMAVALTRATDGDELLGYARRMLQLNDEYHENLTPERVDQLLVEARRSKDARCKATHGPVGIRSRASK